MFINDLSFFDIILFIMCILNFLMSILIYFYYSKLERKLEKFISSTYSIDDSLFGDDFLDF